MCGKMCSGAGSGPAIVGRDPAKDIVFVRLGIVDEDVEIPPLGEARLAGRRSARTPVSARPRTAVFLDKRSIGIFHLRVFVEHPHERVARHSVEIVIVFLDVLAVVAFLVGQAEEPFLEKRVLLVPEGEGQADVLKPVAEAGESVLVPAIDAAAGLVVGEMVPGIAAGAIVFADGAPGPLGEVGAPVLPVARRAALSLKRRCSAVGWSDTDGIPYKPG